MILSLSNEIKTGFTVSEANQGEIRNAGEALEKKLDILTIRTQALKETVGVMKEELEKNKEEIPLLKGSDQEMQDKLKQL
ncbi:hypothetical protein NDU88_001437 [Pleurodeles waltl]|uniref:Uncharacterized protein n=1 Tax=Pleurodeles waltl TaxID=8319 RepID=A0AAV7LZK5_PLEWA|nr:hypothetical protein NDU88_001437 [Pleurodeles waltl]